MLYRKLKDDISVSILGFGAMRLPLIGGTGSPVDSLSLPRTWYGGIQISFACFFHLSTCSLLFSHSRLGHESSIFNQLNTHVTPKIHPSISAVQSFFSLSADSVTTKSTYVLSILTPAFSIRPAARESEISKHLFSYRPTCAKNSLMSYPALQARTAGSEQLKGTLLTWNFSPTTALKKLSMNLK